MESSRAPKERRFLDALESLFTGAEVDGDSGFVNLMRVKRAYFCSIRPMLEAKIDGCTEQGSPFREELFDKLHTFFHRYFCESGSIYFRHIPAFSKTYERVYAEGQDVALSWKTRMLYYVKSDVLVRSMPVELSDAEFPMNVTRFYFDASEIEHKKNNEKREFVFSFEKIARDKHSKVAHIKVAYSQRGVTTRTDDIIAQSRKQGVSLSEDQLRKAMDVFRRQTEADFFINKDARGFLREQFDLWVYQYIFQEETVFEEKRIKQIQTIKDVAYDIIDFIAQFEDELRRIWEKPKFVRNVNYVVTLDKLSSTLLAKIAKHKGMKAQMDEWRELGLVDKGLSSKAITGEDHKLLPLDTAHFKEIELEIISVLGNLDEALDGELVHSENWQALSTLRKRYEAKVKCIYIDPPFNLEGSDKFDYRTNYKDACWATILENRIALAREFLSSEGCIFVRCDYNGNFIVRSVLDDIYGKNNFRNEIIVKRTRTLKGESKKFSTSQDSLFLYSKELQHFKFLGYRTLKPESEQKWVDMHLPGSRKDEDLLYRVFFGKKIKAPKGRRWTLSQTALDNAVSKGLVKMDKKTNMPKFFSKYETLGTNWMDISGYAKDWDFTTENSELLVERCISSVNMENSGYVLDFFAGSGTSQAVAQKLGRKWLGVEMGEHFHSVVLPRMKKVLSGHQSGISQLAKYNGGGCFKYYALEQYEDTLKNARYNPEQKQVELDSKKSPFEQYVFFSDDKLAHAVQSSKTGRLDINLLDLYPDMDIAESLSNAIGKPIRNRTADTVTFADGSTEKTDPAKMTEKEKRRFVSLIKPYLWWGSETVL